MVFECKCHGISASCTTRTCWKALPSIRHIGHKLKEYYSAAVRVKPSMIDSPGGQKPGRLAPMSEDSEKPKSNRLVYLNVSDMHMYCARDVRLRIPGTQDRICNKTSKGVGSCADLCCERGHDTHNFTEVSQCKCKFQWCCEVKCQECVETVVKYTCK